AGVSESGESFQRRRSEKQLDALVHADGRVISFPGGNALVQLRSRGAVGVRFGDHYLIAGQITDLESDNPGVAGGGTLAEHLEAQAVGDVLSSVTAETERMR